MSPKLDASNEWSPALRADGTIIPGESCQDTVANGESCFVGGPPGEGTEPSTVTDLSAHQLSVSIFCQASPGEECVTGATQHKAWAAMYAATVTLNDSTPPTLGTPTGSLWESGTANGFHKGSESVTVEGNDLGGGVQSIVLSADGTPVETYNTPCNFTYPQPCPSATGPQTLTLPTTQLADGTHTLTLTAIDAAGNKSTVASHQVTIDNNPPTAPLDLNATPTQTGGSTFTASWSDPEGQVAPLTEAIYQICPAAGTGSCSAPASAPAAGPAKITVPGPGTWTLAVWLADAAGNSNPANAAHATLTVSESPGGGSKPGEGGGSGGGTGTGSPEGNTGSSGGHGTDGSKPKLHLGETLHRRRLIVHLSGPRTGRVRVSYTARYHARQLAHGTKTVSLKNGRQTTSFKLPAAAALHATIRITARLAGVAAVTSTLHPAPRGKSSRNGRSAAQTGRRAAHTSVWLGRAVDLAQPNGPDPTALSLPTHAGGTAGLRARRVCRVPL